MGASNGDQKEVMDGKGDDCNAPVHHSCPSKKIETFAMQSSGCTARRCRWFFLAASSRCDEMGGW